MRRIYFLVLFTFCLVSCEELIDLPLQDPQALLVIEGKVTNLSTQQEVRLSEVLPFDAEQRTKPVSDADVFLNEENGPWYPLRELGEGRYGIDGFEAESGKSYGLKVQFDGQVYEASSTMPQEVRIDSTGISINTFDGSRQTPLVLFQDPPDVKNFYFFELSINEQALSSLFVYNDKFNDGKYVYQNLDDFDLDLLSGDRVLIEIRNIDEASYHYWNAVRSQGGLSASPGNPPSNISNGALGYFSAYAASRVFFEVE